MPTYRVKAGATLSHDGQVLQSGTVLELPARVAADHAVSAAVEELDETGQPVLPPVAAVVASLAGAAPDVRVAGLRSAIEAAEHRLLQLHDLLHAAHGELAAASSSAPAATPEPAASQE